MRLPLGAGILWWNLIPSHTTMSALEVPVDGTIAPTGAAVASAAALSSLLASLAGLPQVQVVLPPPAPGCEPRVSVYVPSLWSEAANEVFELLRQIICRFPEARLEVDVSETPSPSILSRPLEQARPGG